MGTFAEKTKGPHNSAPAKAEIPAQRIRQSPEVRSVLYPSRTTGGPEPGVAHLDSQGGELQEEPSAELQRSRKPEEPASRPPLDVLGNVVPDALKNPSPTVPGDLIQQMETVPRVNLSFLWWLPRIQERIVAAAAVTEARERANVGPRGQVNHTVAAMTKYWEQKFYDSMTYILYVREGDKQKRRLDQLAAEEAALMKAAPADLVARVEALRRLHQKKWQEEYDRAADRFVVLAANEGLFLTARQNARQINIFGLPEYLEGTVELTDHKDTLVQGKDARPTSPSVVVFMKEVQKQTGTKVLAGNYPDHEKHSPHVGDRDEVGKYSFDVDLGAWIKINSEGFYDREAVIKFFLAVDRAASATRMAWMAFYNDFAVARQVNETLGIKRIGFSGAGDTKQQKGSIHHGPAPYLLHIHFNIMPNDLAAQYFAGKTTYRSDIDLGGSPPPE
jgi:hypothetical protein